MTEGPFSWGSFRWGSFVWRVLLFSGSFGQGPLVLGSFCLRVLYLKGPLIRVLWVWVLLSRVPLPGSSYPKSYNTLCCVNIKIANFREKKLKHHNEIATNFCTFLIRIDWLLTPIFAAIVKLFAPTYLLRWVTYITYIFLYSFIAKKDWGNLLAWE